MGQEGELPIFELPIVLLPGELVPLHIFEPRYRRMIGDCLEQEAPFGIVYRDAEGSARRIGCEARIAEVTERFNDGRMNIIVAGERPFRVLDRFDSPRYPTAEVAPIEPGDEDEEADEDGDVEPGERAGPEDAGDPAASAREAFAELVRRVGGDPPPPEELEEQDSYALAARVELPPQTKQELLERRSELERMRILARAFGALLRTLDRSQEIADRARMNGRVIVRS